MWSRREEAKPWRRQKIKPLSELFLHLHVLNPNCRENMTKHDWNSMQSNKVISTLFYFRKYFFCSFCWTFDYYILVQVKGFGTLKFHGLRQWFSNFFRRRPSCVGWILLWPPKIKLMTKISSNLQFYLQILDCTKKQINLYNAGTTILCVALCLWYIYIHKI